MEKRALKKEDWRELRRIRLHALKSHPEVYGSNFSDENARTDQQWKDFIESTSMHVCGAFHQTTLVGIAAAYDWRPDESKKTACLGMWYIMPEHRGGGHFLDLVKLTVAWVKAQEQYDRIVVSHREGNDLSKAVNQKLGFQYFMSRKDTWPDGQTADNHFYELRIR